MQLGRGGAPRAPPARAAALHGTNSEGCRPPNRPFFVISPNRSLRLWGASFESYNRLVSYQVFPRVPPKSLMRFLSLVLANIHNSGFLKFMISQNVAVAPAKLTILERLRFSFVCPHLLAHQKVAVGSARIKHSIYAT